MPWKNYVKFWKWYLKLTTQSTQNSFLRKSNFKFCVLSNMISLANAQGSVKIRLVFSNVLLLIVSFSNIVVTHSNGYIKDDKYFSFTKLDSANVLLN